MKPRLRWSILLITLAMLLFGSMRSFVAAQAGDEFFPETGHWVSGEFLAKYNSVANSDDLFGLPITDAFRDEETGLLIQYFEKARFELHPDAPAELRVQLTPIGEYLYQPGEPLATPPNFPSCRYFAETDHKVCYAFLDFFEEHGGVFQFGYPISGFEIHDGWISQYFQHARFEWHPELPAGEQVVLADLGIRFFQFRGENPALLQPNIEDAIPLQTVTSLQVHAFASKPVAPTSGEQTFHVIVFDQGFHPVEDATVKLDIELPGRAPVSVEAESTNIDGLSSHQITFEGAQSGTAKVSVRVEYDGIVKRTRTSFQIW
jgi:hypothetical protein